MTLNGTAYRGAKVWVMDISQQAGFVGSLKNIHFVRTNSNGRWMIDIANVMGSNTYSNGDTLRIFYQVGDMIGYTDRTLDVRRQMEEVYIAITRKSGLKDGLKSTKDADGRFAFDNLRGLKPGLKDGMT